MHHIGPREWRTRHQRYSLRAEICEECFGTIFPPRDVCPYCAEERRRWSEFEVINTETEPPVSTGKERN